MMSVANLEQTKQRIRLVNFYYNCNTTPFRLWGMTFYNEKGNEIGQTGWINGEVKTIRLQEDETIIGLRAAPLYDQCFSNLQLVLLKRD